MKAQAVIAFLVLILAACSPKPQSPTPSIPTDPNIPTVSATLTRMDVPSVSPRPKSTEPFVLPPATPMPSEWTATPSPISPYAADHTTIKKVIRRYFDKIYSIHNTFKVDNLGDAVSTGDEAAGFRATKLRELAVEISFYRRNFLRYVYYSFSLNFSEIVVFDSGQRARANFTIDDAVAYESSVNGPAALSAGIKHIVILKNETDGWRILYDVDGEYNDSLYAPTELPKTVLQRLDERLIERNKAQGGPVLPKAGQAFVPSDPGQLERWREYETVLAEKLLPEYPRDKVICEWELTEKSEQALTVWAICISKVTSPDLGSYYYPGASVPAIIHLNADGTIQSVEIPAYGPDYRPNFNKLFPNGAWKDLPDAEAMEKHLHWRRSNPAEPPLIVLNATAILKVTPKTTPRP